VPLTMPATDPVQSFLDLLAANPHTGSTEQVVALSLGIADAAQTLDRNTFSLLRDRSGLNSKVFSKLKIIGETLRAVDQQKLGDVIKKLPASYSTIHALCALKPEELVTAIKSGTVNRTISVRGADAYVKQVRFPYLALQGKEQDLHSRDDVQVFGIYCQSSCPLDAETFHQLEKELNRVCHQYLVTLKATSSKSTTYLKQEDRARKQVLWHSLLEQELTLQWFQQVPDQIKKQFNLRTHEELLNTPLRSFTGFLVNAQGSRDAFWSAHGKAYIAKLHLEQEKTDDKAQRFNLKKRLDDVLGDSRRSELLRWRNQIAKESGVFY
jgi:hypothetical protein